MAKTTIVTYKNLTTINCDGCEEWQPVNYDKGKAVVESEIRDFERRHRKCQKKINEQKRINPN